MLSSACSPNLRYNSAHDQLENGTTSGGQNSWRKAAFQCTITYGTFVKRRVTTLHIVPQVREYIKKQ